MGIQNGLDNWGTQGSSSRHGSTRTVALCGWERECVTVLWDLGLSHITFRLVDTQPQQLRPEAATNAFELLMSNWKKPSLPAKKKRASQWQRKVVQQCGRQLKAARFVSSGKCSCTSLIVKIAATKRVNDTIHLGACDTTGSIEIICYQQIHEKKNYHCQKLHKRKVSTLPEKKKKYQPLRTLKFRH